MNKTQLIFAILIMSFSSLALAVGHGTEGGNGGDLCENRIAIIRDDIDAWVVQGGAEGLELPAEITLASYAEKMRSAMSLAQFSCTNEIVIVNGAQKTCKNDYSASGSARLICNHDRFMGSPESDQYALIHHEYAGLSGFEVNDGVSSDYRLSNQISGFLKNQIIKKLVVKPDGDPQVNRVARDNYGRVLTMDRASAVHYCEMRNLRLPTFQQVVDAWSGRGLQDNGLTSNDFDAISKSFGRAFIWTATLSSDPSAGVLYSKQSDEFGYGMRIVDISSMRAVVCFEKGSL